MGKGETTRETIVDSALSMASERGLEALTIGVLAREAGMSKSGLFAHFSSKENLQLAVIDEAAERFVATVMPPALRAPRGEPRVRAIFERFLDWERAPFLPGGCIFINVANEVDSQPGPVRDRIVEQQHRLLAALGRAAGIAVEEGHFRPDLDLRQFAYDFYSLVLGFHHFQRLLGDPAAEEHLRVSFERLLASCRTPA